MVAKDDCQCLIIIQADPMPCKVVTLELLQVIEGLNRKGERPEHDFIGIVIAVHGCVVFPSIALPGSAVDVFTFPPSA